MTIEFKDITFVIPTNKDVIETLNSIPKGSQIQIRREKTRGSARNAGIEAATTEYIALCDSDISFSEDFLRYVISLTTEKTIVGLQAYYPSPLLISRFMFFKKKIWEDVGSLKEVQHGEETEWLIRALKKGYKLIGVPRESVYHYPHKVSAYKKEYKNLLWLLRLHPDFTLRIIKAILYKMKKSSYEDAVTLPRKDQDIKSLDIDDK
jgi:glycosyltransferase involved in cell wall biosynthesis